MHLRTLYLQNFRLYDEVVFEFCPQVNLICGPNAKGKTTVLEAINVLMTCKSFRTAQLSDMIRKDASHFYIEGIFVKNGLEQRLKFSCDGKERRITFNSTPCASANILGLLQGVVMTPDDASLVKGAPSMRRQFLDIQIAQADPLYVHHATRYSRALRQRNCLLKAKEAVSIESWEYEMAVAASYLSQQRARTIDDLQVLGKSLHQTLTDSKDQLSLAYHSPSPHQQDLAHLREYYVQLFQRHRRREMELGATLNGPQKDDLSILLGEQEARFFASEGQQRSCVAALKLAEWVRLKDQCRETPLMMIDDVGLSLDRGRKEKLFRHLSGLEQVFLTTTEQDIVGDHAGERRVIHLE